MSGWTWLLPGIYVADLLTMFFVIFGVTLYFLRGRR